MMLGLVQDPVLGHNHAGGHPKNHLQKLKRTRWINGCFNEDIAVLVDLCMCQVEDGREAPVGPPVSTKALSTSSQSLYNWFCLPTKTTKWLFLLLFLDFFDWPTKNI